MANDPVVVTEASGEGRLSYVSPEYHCAVRDQLLAEVAQLRAAIDRIVTLRQAQKTKAMHAAITDAFAVANPRAVLETNAKEGA